MNFIPRIGISIRNLATATVLAMPLVLAPAVLQTTLAQTAEQHVPLTPDIVERFIASIGDVKVVTDEVRDQNDISDDSDSFAAYLNYQGAMNKLDGAVQAHGFDNFMGWLPVMSSITSAYTFAKEGGNMDDQMSNAIAQIKANDSLTDQQKDMMIKQMEAASASIGAMRPPQQNIDAVEPYTEQLEIVFDSM